MDQVLVPTSQLDPQFARLFAFGSFNAVQSRCFRAVYQSNDNFVLSAPTSSGKTAVFELAICRLVAHASKRSFKIVYQAPTKSLCAERYRDWSHRFAGLGLRTGVFTGDSPLQQAGSSIQHVDIIITTPEKWDSITRKWKDEKSFVSTVKLFLIDEAHTLGDDRGAVLETVVARMKTITQDVRFIALSATLPNVDDICVWLGKNSTSPTLPASCETFEAGARPVPLELHVHGFPSNDNDFAFEKSLTAHVPGLLKQYSQRRPVIVFCFTRASCIATARYLQDWWSAQPVAGRLWPAPPSPGVVEDQDLADVLLSGIAIHHGGLSSRDRNTVETIYTQNTIGVLCCTSTLAAGVNLPCHMVIVKGTSSFQSVRSGHLQEYSTLDLNQMLGRAGRPQFGNSAVAVIMTKTEHVEHYKTSFSIGQTIESRLHVNLLDHLNAEITLGSVSSLSSAETWLRSTFLYVRLKRNPTHYGLSADNTHNLNAYIKDICANALRTLQDASLVQGTGALASTASGIAMAKYYVQFDTVKLFNALSHTSGTANILRAVSKAAEFNDVYVRASERHMLKVLDQSPSVRFPLGVHIDAAWQKVYLISQWSLSGSDLPEATAPQRKEMVVVSQLVSKRIHRLLKCLSECVLELRSSTILLDVLRLGRSFSAGAWEDSPFVMSQLEGIGPASVRRLVSSDIQSIEDISVADAHTLERALSRNPPFGTELIKKAKKIPLLMLMAKQTSILTKTEVGVTTKVEAEIDLMNDEPHLVLQSANLCVQVLADVDGDRLVHFQRVNLKAGRGAMISFVVHLTDTSNLVRICTMCEDIAGTLKQVSVEIEVPFDLLQTADTSSILSPQDPKQQRTVEDFGDNNLVDQDFAEPQYIDRMVVDDVIASQPSKKPQADSSAAKEQEDDHKLPNGNWRCNHSCKNKSICKHLCCREGLDHPPKLPKPRPAPVPAATQQIKPLRQSSLTKHISQQAPRLSETHASIGRASASFRHTSFTADMPALYADLDETTDGADTTDRDERLGTCMTQATDKEIKASPTAIMPSQSRCAHTAARYSSHGDAGMTSSHCSATPSRSPRPPPVVRDLEASRAGNARAAVDIGGCKPDVSQLARAFLGEKYFVFLDE